MEFTRCTLKKNGSKVVLQGMIHGIPDPFLVWTRNDLRNHARNGYRIFHEGIRTSDDDEKKGNFSKQEMEVLRCHDLMDDIIQKVFKSLGLTYQGYDDTNGEEGIKYPRSSVNIDISNIEYIRLLSKRLAEQNIDCKELMGIIKKVTLKRIVNEVAKNIDKLLKGEVTCKELDNKEKALGYLKIMDFFKVSDTVSTGYRNEVASDHIEKYSKKKRYKKLYVHYGEAHIEGMTKLLVDKGWKLVKTDKIDSQNPGLRKRRPKASLFYDLRLTRQALCCNLKSSRN